MTHDTSEAKVTVAGVPDRPGVAARLFRALAERAVNVDMIVQNTSLHGTTDISFTVPETRPGGGGRGVPRSSAGELGRHRGDLRRRRRPGCRSIGAGMKTHPGVTATMFETLAADGINIEMISTSTIRISCMVRDRAEVERAVRALHGAFELAERATGASAPP